MASGLAATGYGVDLGSPGGINISGNAPAWDNSLTAFGIGNTSETSPNTSSIPDWGALNGVRDWLGSTFVNTIGGGDVKGNANPFSLDNVLNPSDLNQRVTTAQNTGFWSDLFLRSVVIILGFIFVAVGLSMFKGGSIIEQVKSK